MALVDDALAYESAVEQLAIDEAAHELTGIALASSQIVRKDAVDLIQQQFALDGHFVHAFVSGSNTIVIDVQNGLLHIDIVVTE